MFSEFLRQTKMAAWSSSQWNLMRGGFILPDIMEMKRNGWMGVEVIRNHDKHTCFFCSRGMCVPCRVEEGKERIRGRVMWTRGQSVSTRRGLDICRMQLLLHVYLQQHFIFIQWKMSDDRIFDIIIDTKVFVFHVEAEHQCCGQNYITAVDCWCIFFISAYIKIG